MRVQICAVGRLRAGPERDLIDDYLSRFDKAGRSLGLGPCTVTEVEDRKGGGANEGALLAKAIPEGAFVAALDERGKALTSPQFADVLALGRDHGRSTFCLVIGGADGIAPGLRQSLDMSISFGAMVWPHMLARVMLAEQLYRTTQILAGTPYHRA